MTLEITFDHTDESMVSMWIRPQSPVLVNVKVEPTGMGPIDVSELIRSGSHISGGIGPIDAVNIVLKGGDTTWETIKALRKAAEDLEKNIKGH